MRFVQEWKETAANLSLPGSKRGLKRMGTQETEIERTEEEEASSKSESSTTDETSSQSTSSRRGTGEDTERRILKQPVTGTVEAIEKTVDKGKEKVTLSVRVDGDVEEFTLKWPSAPKDATTENELLALLEAKDIPPHRLADLRGESVTVVRDADGIFQIAVPNDNPLSRRLHRLFVPLFRYQLFEYTRGGLTGPEKLRPTLRGKATILLCGFSLGLAMTGAGTATAINPLEAFGILLSVITGFLLAMGIATALVFAVLVLLHRAMLRLLEM